MKQTAGIGQIAGISSSPAFCSRKTKNYIQHIVRYHENQLDLLFFHRVFTSFWTCWVWCGGDAWRVNQFTAAFFLPERHRFTLVGRFWNAPKLRLVWTCTVTLMAMVCYRAVNTSHLMQIGDPKASGAMIKGKRNTSFPVCNFSSKLYFVFLVVVISVMCVYIPVQTSL